MNNFKQGHDKFLDSSPHNSTDTQPKSSMSSFQIESVIFELSFYLYCVKSLLHQEETMIRSVYRVESLYFKVFLQCLQQHLVLVFENKII